MSKNTNELKTGPPGRFGIDVSTFDWPMGARILGHEHAGPALDLVGSSPSLVGSSVTHQAATVYLLEENKILKARR